LNSVLKKDVKRYETLVAKNNVNVAIDDELINWLVL